MFVNEWYRRTRLGEACHSTEHCRDCEPNGCCDACDTVDGRWTEAVFQYASTCDWCGDLCSNSSQTLDKMTHLGYCPDCVDKLPDEVKARLQGEDEELWPFGVSDAATDRGG